MRKSYEILGDNPWVDKVAIDGKIVNFPDETPDYCIYDNKVIIALSLRFLKEKYPEENPGRNIWCYRDDGTLLWKIEESPVFFTWPEEYKKENPDKKDYYEGVAYYKGRREGTRLKKGVPIEAIDEWRRDDRIRIWENYDETGEWLWARTSTGYYDLNPETGKVSNFTYDGGR